MIWIVIALTPMTLALLLAWIRAESRSRHLQQQRPNWGRDSFVNAFSRRVPRELLDHVFIFFVECAGKRNFPVMPSDSLEQTYFIEGEDLVDELRELSRRCGRQPPPPEEIAQIATVQDVVLALNRSPQRSSTIQE